MDATAMIASCCLGGAALAAAGVRSSAKPRLRRLHPVRRPARRARDLRRPVAWLAGAALAAVAGGWWGLAAGAVTAVALDRLLRRLPPAAQRAARERAAADLPVAADLLAAGLRSGAPVNRVVGAVAQAVGGPLGESLLRVARSLDLGADSPEAWAHLDSIRGAGRLVRAAVRSSTSGGALAGAFTRVADDLRADRAVAAEAAARRAGVLIVLPLGLCFLP
ncbi:MAG TPA: type II secretion system F family protein, partial [Pilimelia sp.]|nr:type II secretion system F family protein [Pilimelia sp.]